MRDYADNNGYEVDIEHNDVGKSFESHIAEVRATKAPMNDRQKDVVRLRNAAMVDNDDTALHALADKLEEIGAPAGKFLTKQLAESNPANARHQLRWWNRNRGSILANGKFAGGTGKTRVTESVNVKRKQWHATEDACSPEVRVDREKGVIYNVLVLGRKARNGRRYTNEAMEEALGEGLYEKLQVYIGPHKRKKWDKRSPKDHAGELRGTYKAADGIRAKEFHVNRASLGGKLALELAERFPNAFGLSHHAEVAGYEKDGEKIVTRILEVAVADIVKDAATTDGVFEEVETVVEDGDPAVQATPDAVDTGWQGPLKDLIAAIHADDTLDDDVKLQATKAAMKLKKLLAGDDSDDEPDDATPAPGEEEVDTKALLKRIAALESAAKRKPQKPKSTARSTVTEDATPKPPATPAKPVFPKKTEEILAAYEDAEDS